MKVSGNYLHPVFLLVLVMGIALRFIALGQQSLWFDEAHSVVMAQGGADGSLLRTVANTHGPLYLLLLRMWIAFFGTSEQAVRALSAALGSLGLILFYRLGLKLLGRPASLVALALLAASPFYLWYSQEARNYALLFALGVIAVPAFLLEMKSKTTGSFAAALFATAAVCLANLSGFFLYALYGACVLVAGRSARYPLRRLALLAVLSVVILSPWIVGGSGSTGDIHLGRPDESAGTLAVKGESPPGLLSIPYTFYNFSLGMSFGPSIDELKLQRFAAAIPHMWYIIPAAALFAIMALRGLLRAPASSRTLLVLWIAAPVFLMVAISVLNLKAPNSRYAFLALPPYVLLLSAGITSTRGGPLKGMLLAALLGFMGLADYNYFTDRRYWRPDARSAGELLLREVKPDDAVVVYALDVPVRYYLLRGEIGIVKPARKTFEDEATMEAWLGQNTEGKRRVWIVQCMGWWVDREDKLVRLCRDRMTLEGEWRFTKVPVYLFSKPSPAEPQP